jgi:hypothetical protein
MKITVPRIEQVADWGSEEPWVARIEIGIPELIRGLRHQSEETEKLLWTFHQIPEELSSAFIALRKIQKGGMLKLEANKEYSNLYGHLWSAYKDRLQTFMKEFGYDIGFVFQKQSTFEKRIASYCKENDLPEDFARSVIHDRNNWQNPLSEIRNDFNEHRKLPHNFDEKYFKKDLAKIMFDNVWMAIEDMIAIHIKTEFGKTSRSVTFYEIPENERDEAMPVRFRISLTPEAYKNLEKARKAEERKKQSTN